MVFGESLISLIGMEDRSAVTGDDFLRLVGDFDDKARDKVDLVLICASYRVNKGDGAGDGERLESGDFTGDSDRECDRDLVGSIVEATLRTVFLGGSLGNAISRSALLSSSRFSTSFILLGLVTFLPMVSRAFAARPDCKRFRVFISRCRSSSSLSSCCCCFDSISATLSISSSSLDDLRLTRGCATTRDFFVLEGDLDLRDFGLDRLARSSPLSDVSLSAAGVALEFSWSRRFDIEMDAFFLLSSCRISL